MKTAIILRIREFQSANLRVAKATLTSAGNSLAFNAAHSAIEFLQPSWRVKSLKGDMLLNPCRVALTL
jgi:hypothetical protein